MYKLSIFKTLKQRLEEPRRFIQVLTGPRQVGKTTLSQQLIKAVKQPTHYASADEPTLKDSAWLAQQWDIGRLKAKDAKQNGALLILDEIQKIDHWSEVVKQHWDEDTRNKVPLKILLLGSAPLLIQTGLKESLGGRFENLPVTHWSYSDMKTAFGWDLEQYIYFGGYPGAADIVSDENRWRQYINDSLIETTISRDILLMTRIDKPALLRRLFLLGCEYSGQILSYQKMVGQLQDAGNTTTLAHYLDLLAGAGMLTGLQKYAANSLRKRASSPKLQVLNTALLSALNHLSFKEAIKKRDYWGRLVESAVGAHCINDGIKSGIDVFYWHEQNQEVDFVLQKGKSITAIEVKSGRSRGSLPGMARFADKFNPTQKLLVGGQGIPIEEFLLKPLESWL